MAVRATMAAIITRVRVCLLIGLNVLRNSTVDDISYIRFADTEHQNKATITSTLFAELANFKHLLSSQFGMWMRLTFGQIKTWCVVVPVLSGAVSDVIGRSCEKKMLRIDARRIITGMTNKHALGDTSAVCLVGYSTSNASLPVDFNSPISLISTHTAMPKPTSVITAAPIAKSKQSVFDFHWQDAFRFGHCL